jgi:hypothetical protein
VRGTVLGQCAGEKVVDGTSLVKQSGVGSAVVEKMKAGVGVEQQPQRVALVQVPVHAHRNGLACEVHSPASNTSSVHPKDPIRAA